MMRWRHSKLFIHAREYCLILNKATPKTEGDYECNMRDAEMRVCKSPAEVKWIKGNIHFCVVVVVVFKSCVAFTVIIAIYVSLLSNNVDVKYS